MCFVLKRRLLGPQSDDHKFDPLPQKMSAIIDFLRPSSVRKLRKFLGIINYYYRFIIQAAARLAPLQDLQIGVKKNSSKPFQ